MSLIAPYVMFPGGGGGGLDVSYIGTSTVAVGANTHTYTDHAIGAADAARVVYVGISLEADTNSFITGVTIGGSAASEVVQHRTAQAHAAIWKLAVAGGTTATIVITVTGGKDIAETAIHVYRVLNGTDGDTTAVGGDTAATLTLDVNTLTSGVIIAVGMMEDFSTSFTWVGVTEQFDAVISGGTATATSAFVTGLSAETPRTVTLTPAAGDATNKHAGAVVAIS